MDPMALFIATLKFAVNFLLDQVGAQIIDFLIGLF